ncbi:MAG: CDGSH iron-sulfur domain-containing protein [Parvularculaceae bacterium]|nr:CDGSH iron-sulfur domain-containing protein [Parvularculaceae bacterium]
MTERDTEPPRIAERKPFLVELQKGRRYQWCRCGQSRRQPFCDGRAHLGTGFEPLFFEAERDEEVLLCACKRTGDAPFCDGAHNNLPDGYREDDPDSAANRTIPEIVAGASPIAMLDGGCYVFSPDRATLHQRNGFRYCDVITERQGALYQSLFFATLAAGASQILSFGARDTVIFLAKGSMTINIGDRTFDCARKDGFIVKPGEAFQLSAKDDCALYFSVCPHADGPAFPESLTGDFDETSPLRRAETDPAHERPMASRTFQVLINKEHGSNAVTQFIGKIPRSKAEPHRHLYEESLIILSGEGCMWTENAKAHVRGGDVIFLPRKQLHSLQCVSDAPMEVVGVIYPGDNPSINY